MDHAKLKQPLIILLYVCYLLCISACSSLPSMDNEQGDDLPLPPETIPGPAGQTNEQSAMVMPTFAEHLAQWQEIKPSIERLVAIESELKELITQLNIMVKEPTDIKATNDNSPDQTTSSGQTARVTSTTLAEPEPSQPLASEPVPATANISTVDPKSIHSEYAIQLFSTTNKTLIELTWNEILQKHKDILTKLHPIYEEVTLGDNKFYRVKAAGFSSREATLEMCRQLQLLDTPCIPTNAVGNKF